MKYFLFTFIALISCACASEEFFNLPDLAFIPTGTYNVFPGAPNKNGKFETIQGAIDQALCDGFTPEANPFQTAIILIYPSNNPYTGDSINNEINVPASIILKGAPSLGSAIVEPQIKATVIFRNDGVALDALPNFVADFKLSISAINFIQPSADKPAIKVINNPSFLQFYYIFDAFELVNENPDSTAPVAEIRGGSFVGFFRGFVFSNSKNAAAVISYDATSPFFTYCNILCYRWMKFVDNGFIPPVTGGYFYYNDVSVYPAFKGFQDSEIKIIEMNGKSIGEFMFFFNAVASFFGTETYTKGQVFFDASGVASDSDLPRIKIMSNVISLIPGASGTQLVYNAPNSTIVVGNTIDTLGVTASVAGNLIPSIFG